MECSVWSSADVGLRVLDLEFGVWGLGFRLNSSTADSEPQNPKTPKP